MKWVTVKRRWGRAIAIAWLGSAFLQMAVLAELPLWVKRILNPKPPTPVKVAGSKGNVCLISPFAGGDPIKVWSRTPVFVWQGTVESFVVTNAEGAEVWRVDQVPAGSSRLVYSGEALEPGQVYEWTIYEGDVPTMFAQFQMVSMTEVAEIAEALKTVQRELEIADYSKADLALARTNYFAERGLWMDALAESELTGAQKNTLGQYREEFQQMLCD